jgi:hypothetical protein
MPERCLQEDLEHGLRARDFLLAAVHYTFLERFGPRWPLFALGTSLSKSIDCAFATINLIYVLVLNGMYEL